MLYKPTSNRFFATISYKKSPELCALGLYFLMLYDAELEVRVHLCPLCYWRNDAELYNLVAHLAEVLVRLSERSKLLFCACRLCEVNASLVDVGIAIITFLKPHFSQFT